LYNKLQKLQEDEYRFPYHYVSSFDKTFKQTYTDKWAINYVSTIEYILGVLEQIKFSSVVDIGCGDGRFTSEISKRFPDKLVLGIDYSLKAINLAKAMNQYAKNISFISCDITNSWKGKKHDIAVLLEVFEHIPIRDEKAFISGLHKLLRQNGDLFLTVPHINKPVEYKHFRHFSAHTIVESLKSHFEIVKILPFERISIFRKILQFLLVNHLFVLNNQKLLDWIYKYYKNNLFFCKDESECQRIFIRAKAK
jgi:2-polyprenyl-3-methyl-5-hydroxy-6-metoxy-1,4-benzoquinol methylase